MKTHLHPGTFFLCLFCHVADICEHTWISQVTILFERRVRLQTSLIIRELDEYTTLKHVKHFFEEDEEFLIMSPLL